MSGEELGFKLGKMPLHGKIGDCFGACCFPQRY